MRSRVPASRPRAGLGAALGASGSLLLHAAVLALLRWAGTMPQMDFALELPSEVEFGVSEPAAVAEPPPAPPAQPEAVAAAAPPEGAAIEPPRERRPPRRRERADAGTEEDRSDGDADAATAPVDAGPPDEGQGERPVLAAYAPKGAQIALRVHLGRVRDSELAPDVRSLLGAVADWRLILEGSGLDPLQDLERLYIASPDLRRAHLVIAGQYVGGKEVAQRAVASMAAARGLPAAWRTYGPVQVAPWHNLDETERVLALIAPHQFAITRSEDLTRVLQVARALAKRRTAESKRAVDPAEALLALDHDETLALSVEGARLFARGNLRGVPERLNASVRILDGAAGLDVRVTGHFESADAADAARDYWNRVRERYAGHPLVALIGLRAPLADATVSAEGTEVEARTRVTLQQARIVLGFIRDAVAPPPPPPPPIDAEPVPAPDNSPGTPGGPDPGNRTLPFPAGPISPRGP